MTSAAPARKPYRKAPPQHRETRVYSDCVFQEALSDSDRIRILQQQNEDLRRRLALSTHKMEAMEAEFDGSRHYMEAELSRTRDDLDKMRDKFRRLQNSYTASQRANQDLEEKLHALVNSAAFIWLRKVERDKKTMDQEIVELTNKLLDAKNTIDRLEELNERYRQDCNLAVQLLKCNKSHFRNHKFADVRPGHAQSDSGRRGADLGPSLESWKKPEPLVLNSAQSSTCGRPMAEERLRARGHDGFGGQCRGPGRAGEWRPGGATAERLLSQSEQSGRGGGRSLILREAEPIPGPAPAHPSNPGRKVIEFSSDDKVKIPKNSPLPNCTYATRQAISLSLVQNDDERASVQPLQQPATGKPRPPPSPESHLCVMASSGSSEEDLLANWQRMFLEKMPPACDSSLVHRTSFSSQTAQELQRRRPAAGGGASSSDRHRAAYSDGEEGSSARSWTPSRGSSLDTDTDTEPRPGGRAPAEEPQRMGVHHLHRKDSLTRAQEHGTLLD
uniref:Tight junction associated protein 1 (peripheral) n=1 Tax=Amphiprion percula TaxID=161767 RepID=A0A3P8TM31_AMPPE